MSTAASAVSDLSGMAEDSKWAESQTQQELWAATSPGGKSLGDDQTSPLSVIAVLIVTAVQVCFISVIFCPGLS